MMCNNYISTEDQRVLDELDLYTQIFIDNFPTCGTDEYVEFVNETITPRINQLNYHIYEEHLSELSYKISKIRTETLDDHNETLIDSTSATIDKQFNDIMIAARHQIRLNPV